MSIEKVRAKAREHGRLEDLGITLRFTIDKLNESYSALLTDRGVDAFGTDYVSDEDQRSIENGDATLRRLHVTMDVLEDELRKARNKLLKLTDDGSRPPF